MASDGARTATATVTITVDPSAPVAQNDAITIASNQVDIQVYVLGNDLDPNGDTLHVASVTAPANGTTGVNGNPLNGQPQIVQYTPNSGFAGTDTFTYVASDGARTATATVTVEVLAGPGPNLSPVAVADAATTRPNQRVDIYVTGNDTDADGDPLLPAAVVVAPTNGSASVVGSVIVYEPNSGFAGTTPSPIGSPTAPARPTPP